VIILTKAKSGKAHDKRQLNQEMVVEQIPDDVSLE
jgi:hypothetical protein